MRSSFPICLIAACWSGALFAQTTPPNTVAAAGYVAPAPISVAPGQLITIFVQGVGRSLTQPGDDRFGAKLQKQFPVRPHDRARPPLQDGLDREQIGFAQIFERVDKCMIIVSLPFVPDPRPCATPQVIREGRVELSDGPIRQS